MKEECFEGITAAYLDKCLAHPPETHISTIPRSLIPVEVILSHPINLKCRIIKQFATMRTQRRLWPELFTPGFDI